MTGIVHLRQMGEKLHLKGIIYVGNMTNLTHGFHVHETGDLGNDCANALGHYNPQVVRNFMLLSHFSCFSYYFPVFQVLTD